MWKLSGSAASVEVSLTHQAAGTITQLLLGLFIAWKIALTRRSTCIFHAEETDWCKKHVHNYI